jgi:hypothetical protein
LSPYGLYTSFLKLFVEPGIVYISVTPALRRLRLEDLEFEASEYKDSLGYIVRPCLKKKKKL